MKLPISIFLNTVTLGIFAPRHMLDERSDWNVGQQVFTSSGPVEGHPAANASGVSEYLGIPFAEPPVGDLRFEPPQPYSGKSIINGSNFGHSCPQVLPTAEDVLNEYNSAPPGLLTPVFLTWSLGQIEAPITLSEDCLTLNIWTKPQVGEKSKAVLLWIYGGGYVSGVTQVKYNYGQHLAEEGDVVVVSINYRLGILGFPGSPDGPFNSGFLDQRLAIEWVYANIAAFGGDPTRITLVGQSAGANSNDFYSYAYPSDPIVSSTILESGTAFSLSYIGQPSAVSAWQNVSTTVGCGDQESDVDEVYQCMKTISWETLLAAVPSPYAFWPTTDEKFVFSNYTEQSLLGHVAKLPLLIGNNDNEAGSIKIPTLLDPATTLPDSYWENLELLSGTCPAGQRANASIYNHVPAWRYRWFGAFPDLQLTYNPNSGAWHGEEIAIIWDTVPVTPGVSETRAEREVAKYTRGAWVAFAKDPWHGLERYDNWPRWNPAEKSLIRLAYDNKTGTNAVYGAVYDEGCAAGGVTMPTE